VDAPHSRRLAGRQAVTETAVEDLPNQEIFIDVGEHFSDGGRRDATGDPHGLELAEHPELPVPLDVRLRARAGQRGPAVVERPFAPKTFHGGVHGVRLELAAREPQAQLRLTELAAGQHPQARDVGIRHLVNCRANVGGSARGCSRSASRHPPYEETAYDAVPPAPARAISSRAMSDVVVMPVILSLNSSTFEAQRSASSSVTSFCSYSR